MPIQWGSAEVLERLFTATLASLDNKINIHEVARLYGEGMTYHALENQLRKVKKEATKMKEEAVGREAAAPSPAKPRARKGDTSPTKGAVKTGRVTKKKAPATKIRVEAVVDDDMLFDDASEGVKNSGIGGNGGGGLDDDEYM